MRIKTKLAVSPGAPLFLNAQIAKRIKKLLTKKIVSNGRLSVNQWQFVQTIELTKFDNLRCRPAKRSI